MGETQYKFGVISLFPEMFSALDYGIPGQAQHNRAVTLTVWNPRDFSREKHRRVDERPYGGGPGMVMMYQPIHDAVQAAKASLGQQTQVIYVSPAGPRLTHQALQTMQTWQRLIIVAGRYEGIDARLLEQDIDATWSLGDYVISGGEIAAMVVIDAIIRLIPGILGHAESALQDSFAQGILDHPHYTRPEVVNGLKVPSILLSGDHDKIARWRLQQALLRTWQLRPDLLTASPLPQVWQELLDETLANSGEEHDELD